VSCYITTDANGVQTRHFTGDATMSLTSASDGGAGYVAPTCALAPIRCPSPARWRFLF